MHRRAVWILYLFMLAHGALHTCCLRSTQPPVDSAVCVRAVQAAMGGGDTDYPVALGLALANVGAARVLPTCLPTYHSAPAIHTPRFPSHVLYDLVEPTCTQVGQHSEAESAYLDALAMLGGRAPVGIAFWEVALCTGTY